MKRAHVPGQKAKVIQVGILHHVIEGTSLSLVKTVIVVAGRQLFPLFCSHCVWPSLAAPVKAVLPSAIANVHSCTEMEYEPYRCRSSGPGSRNQSLFGQSHDEPQLTDAHICCEPLARYAPPQPDKILVPTRLPAKGVPIPWCEGTRARKPKRIWNLEQDNYHVATNSAIFPCASST